MQDTELFLSLAEIAGVFVGFGALISVRTGSTSEAHEVTYIRAVVTGAIWVVVAALAPVILSRYDIAGHELWAACSLVALVLWFGLWIVNERAPESRELAMAYSRAETATMMVSNLLLTIPLMGALILVLLGAFVDHEPALYLTAVGLGLCLGAMSLLVLVLSQRRAQPASGPAARPATEGSGG